MHGVKEGALGAVILLLAATLSHAQGVPLPEPDPGRGTIAVTVRGWFPVRGTAQGVKVYFVRLEQEANMFATAEVLASDFSNREQVYLLNAEPGRYVAVAALVREEASRKSEFKVFLDQSAIGSTEIEVTAGGLVFMGRLLVDLKARMKNSDAAQAHYSRLIAHSKKRVQRGSLLLIDREPSTQTEHWTLARNEVFQGQPAWKARVEEELAEVTRIAAQPRSTGPDSTEEPALAGTTWVGTASPVFDPARHTSQQRGDWAYVFDFLDGGTLLETTRPVGPRQTIFSPNSTNLPGTWRQIGRKVYLEVGSSGGRPTHVLVGTISGDLMSGDGLSRVTRTTWSVERGKPDSLTQWKILSDLGADLCCGPGDYEEAERNLLAALGEAEGLGLEEAPMGYQQLRGGPLGRLKPIMEPLDPPLAETLDHLAELYGVQGRYADQEEVASRSLAMREKALGPDDRHVAWSATDLARSYDGLGRPAEAEKLYQRALAIFENDPGFGPDNPATGRYVLALADHYQLQGKSGEAAPLYERALKLFEQGGDLFFQSEVAHSSTGLAEVYLARRNYEQAESYSQRALQILEPELANAVVRHGESTHSARKLREAVARTLRGYAQLLRETGRETAAIEAEVRASGLR